MHDSGFDDNATVTIMRFHCCSDSTGAEKKSKDLDAMGEAGKQFEGTSFSFLRALVPAP